VNNAGIGGGTTAVDIDVARAGRVLEVNLYAYIGAHPRALERPWSRRTGG